MAGHLDHLDTFTDRRYGRPMPATSYSDKRPVHPEYAGAKCQDCGKKAVGMRESLGAGHWSQVMNTPVCKQHKDDRTRPLPRMDAPGS